MQESGGVKTLELVFFDAGGGHRSAANALCEVVRRQQRPPETAWDMQMMNLQELLDEYCYNMPDALAQARATGRVS